MQSKSMELLAAELCCTITKNKRFVCAPYAQAFFVWFKNWLKERLLPTLSGNNRIYIFLLNIATMMQKDCTVRKTLQVNFIHN